MYKFIVLLVGAFIFFSCGKNIEEKKKESEKLFSKAVGLYELGQLYEAESLLLDALKIEQVALRHDYLGHIQLYLGLINFQHARYYSSLDYYQRAMKEYEITQDLKNQSVVLTNIGGIYAYLNQYQNAIDIYNKSYSISRFSLDKESQAIALSNIALAYDALEDYDKSYDFFNKAIIMNKISDDNIAVATNLNNLGELFFHQGKLNQALKYFEESLSLSTKTHNVDLEGVCLKNIGNILRADGKNEEALNVFFNSILKARLAPNPDLEREILNNIGEIYFKTYQYDRAKMAFEEALNIARGKEDKLSEGFFLNWIGVTQKSLAQAGDDKALDNAEKYFNDALAVYKNINYSLGISSAYYNLANIFEIRKLTDKAIEYYKNAIRIRENLIEPPKNSFLFRLLQSEEMNYAPLINLLLQKGRNEDAFLYLERQKTRKLADLLKSSKMKFKNKDIESLYKKITGIKNEISSLYYSYVFEASKPQKAEDRSRVSALIESIINKKEEYSIARNEILKTGTILNYYVDIPVSSLKEIQSKIPENSLIVEHFPADTNLYIFTLSRDLFDVKRVPLSSEVLTSQKALFLNLIYSKNNSGPENGIENGTLYKDLKITLFNHLFSPIDAKIKNITKLFIIIPDNEILFPVPILFNGNDKYKNIDVSYISSFNSIKWTKEELNDALDISILGDRFKYPDFLKQAGPGPLNLKFIPNSQIFQTPNNRSDNSVLFIIGGISDANKKLNNLFIKITPYDSLSFDNILSAQKSKAVFFLTDNLNRPEIPLLAELFLFNGCSNVVCYSQSNESNALINECLLNIKNNNSIKDLKTRINNSSSGLASKIFIFGK
jgi:tetratricopeptide (TPR) repeat protein